MNTNLKIKILPTHIKNMRLSGLNQLATILLKEEGLLKKSNTGAVNIVTTSNLTQAKDIGIGRSGESNKYKLEYFKDDLYFAFTEEGEYITFEPYQNIKSVEKSTYT
jgi:hypothetical protein